MFSNFVAIITMDNRITLIYGNNPFDMTKKLLDSIDLESRIEDKGKNILLKPNLVISSDPSNGATTHTEIVIATIEYLQDHGFYNITVAEGSWVGSRTEEAFKDLGYYAIEKKYGIKLINTKKDRFVKVRSSEMDLEIASCALDADFIINMPVLKGHCQTLMTHAMKNMKGLLSDKSKREFHTRGLDLPIVRLTEALKSDLVISDSINGDLDFEEGGNPIETNRMMASFNAVLLDSYAASLMGFSVNDIKYLKIYNEFHPGSTDIRNAEIIELNRPEGTFNKPSGLAKRLSAYTESKDACSACYASLIHALKRLDDEKGLRRLDGIKIKIGQGYRNQETDIGVGLCCKSANVNVLGCPAKADDILKMLRSL